jgi:uncharacterized cupin superfamily protein
VAIPFADIDVELEPWQPEGVTILEGDPQGRGATIHEAEQEGHFVGVYVFACQPARTSYLLEQNEILHVLEGEVEITLDDGSKVELRPGGVAFLPKGQTSYWWFKTPFRELAIVSG